MDNLTLQERSKLMARIKSYNTAPEIVVRKIVYSKGYRYRLHDKSLPSRPDIVFKSRKKVIFVNGCFWHRHKCKRGCYFPKVNEEYWSNKFERTKARDKNAIRQLKKLGWSVLTVWECETKEIDYLSNILNSFLDNDQEESK
ncbi:MAG: very short patch repair endonuclease [Bacteroidales bacterium]